MANLVSFLLFICDSNSFDGGVMMIRCTMRPCACWWCGSYYSTVQSIIQQFGDEGNCGWYFSWIIIVWYTAYLFYGWCTNILMCNSLSEPIYRKVLSSVLYYYLELELSEAASFSILSPVYNMILWRFLGQIINTQNGASLLWTD